jgi:hypothetical protein
MGDYKLDAEGVFHTGLQCRVIGVSYDYGQRLGRLDMPPVNCCDMSGCLGLFLAIDPDCAKIETFTGGKPDTAYVRRPAGWEAIDPRGVAMGVYEP